MASEGEVSDTSRPLQTLARLALASALVVAGLWVLREFLAALLWAVILAIALWPLYRRLLRLLPPRCEAEVAPLILVVLVAFVFIGPIVILGVAIAREAHVVVELVSQARHNGIPVPDWVGALPMVGSTAADWWRANLGDPATVQELFGRINPRALAESAREYGAVVAHRLVLLGFTLLTLFFLFREGAALTEQLRRLGDRVIGRRGERIALHMVAAVHGTVSGLVLVGLAEGAILGVVYFLVGLPYPASMGALTGVAAVIPFAAPVVFCLAGLYMAAVGKTIAAIIVVAAGGIVVFVADHAVRPVLIGGAARLPFLWVLLGTLGGLGSFGFLGLFLGPAIMAALVALWREWTEIGPSVAPAPVRLTPSPAAPTSPARRRPSGRGGRG